MRGEGGNDVLRGLAGNDSLEGGAGDDALVGGDGVDTLDGGTSTDDFDALRYIDEGGTQGVTVNLVAGGDGSATDSFGKSDVIRNIEFVVGTNFGDRITGSSNSEGLAGLGGNDTLDGGADNTDEVRYNLDTFDPNGGDSGVIVNLSGTAINVILNGDSHTVQGNQARDGFGSTDSLTNIERVVGTFYADVLQGDGLNNRFRALGGDDTINGGDGTDEIDYRRDFQFTPSAGNALNVPPANQGVIVNLGTTTLQNINVTGASNVAIEGNRAKDGSGGVDVLSGIENARGTDFTDVLVGGAGVNNLRGEGGNDNLAGGEGADVLDGGAGFDRANYGLETGGSGVIVNLSGANVTATIAAGTFTVAGNRARDTYGTIDTLIDIEAARGTSNADYLVGNDFSNTLLGRGGADTLIGGGGADELYAGGGTDRVDGTASAGDTDDSDAVVYSFAGDGIEQNQTGVIVNLSDNNVVVNGELVTARTARDDFGGIDTLIDIEGVRGTMLGDYFVGRDTSGELNPDHDYEFFQGAGGNDTIDGGGGYDSAQYHINAQYTVNGMPATRIVANLSTEGVTRDGVTLQAGQVADGLGGTDTLISIEQVLGTHQNDWFVAGGHASTITFRGFDGADTFEQIGTSSVRVDYSRDVNQGGSRGVVVNLSDETFTTANGTEVLSGQALDSFGKTDTLINIHNVRGTNNSDVFVSSTGDDRFQGMGGPDRFVFGPQSGIDTIVGFEPGYDVLDLSAAGIQSFEELGITQIGDHAEITFGNGNTIVIENFDANWLSSEDFRFVDAPQREGARYNVWQEVGLDWSEVFRWNFVGEQTAEKFIVQNSDLTYTVGFGTGLTYEGGKLTGGLIYGLARRPTQDVGDPGTGPFDMESLYEINPQVDAAQLGNMTNPAQLLAFLLKGDDEMFGNEQGNDFSGGDGQDTLDGADGNDTLFGDDGHDLLLGQDNDDVLHGHAGNDWVDGGAGNDTLFGEDGDDGLWGGAGNDSLVGGTNGPFVDMAIYRDSPVGVTVDLVLGTAQDGFGTTDKLVGIEGVEGSDGADNLKGDDGVNWFRPGLGNDTIDGRGGEDTVFYEHSEVGFNIDLKAGTAVAKDGTESDTLLNIENAHGSMHADTITLGDGNSYVFGRQGHDTIIGGAGNNYIVGGGGADSIVGGGGVDTASYFEEDPDYPHEHGVNVNLGTESAIDNWGAQDVLKGMRNVRGSNFGDTLIGDGNSNRLQGEGGNDSLRGAGAADVMIGGAGNDTLDGTAVANDPDDFDTADYQSDGGQLGVSVNLSGEAVIVAIQDLNGNVIENRTIQANSAVDTFGNVDTLMDIEDVRGTSKADVLVGGNVANDVDSEGFTGLAGRDTIDGGSGVDQVNYSGDVFAGGTAGVTVNLATGVANDGFGHQDTLRNIEQVIGTNQIDTFTGNADNNRFRGLGGADVINGGEGMDEIDHRRDANQTGGGQAVIVNLSGSTITATIESGSFQVLANRARDGFGQLDQLTSIESARGTEKGDYFVGSVGANRFRGEGGNDRLFGGDGSDTLEGGSGNDSLVGGSAFDVLAGGAGNDTLDGTGTGQADPDDTDQADYGSETGLNGILVNLTKTAATMEVRDANGIVTGTRSVQGQSAIDTFGATDTFIDIEEVRGSGRNDSILGGNTDHDDWGEFYTGLAGNDTIDGGSGFDQVNYSSDRFFQGGDNAVIVDLATGVATDGFGHQDTLLNIEAVVGTRHADTFTGSDGNDRFRGLGGADIIDGGEGRDELDHRRDANQTGGGQAVIVNLSDSTISATIESDTFEVQSNRARDGFGQLDQLTSIESARGTEKGDYFVGSESANRFRGEGGNDTLMGGGGDDTLEGGSGNDIVDGGTGNDLHVAAAGSNTLTIVGFTAGGVEDVIDVKALGFTTLTQVQAAAIEVPVGDRTDTVISSGTNGANKIVLQGVSKASLTAGNFVFSTGPVGKAPVITSNGGGAAAAINVAENTKAVTKVIATDADGPALTYSIVGGADQAKFAIDSATGVLTFIAAPDYETRTDAGENNVYDVVVQVSDGTSTDSQAIAVTVTNANENIVGGIGNDPLTGGVGGDVIDGLAGNDTLVGNGGNDTLKGGSGDDVFVGGDGADVIDGSHPTNDPDEFDTLRYSTEGGNLGVVVDLEAGTATDTFGHTDSLIDIEQVIGTSKADSFLGSNESDYFAGLAGNDTIDGGEGVDQVRYNFDAEFTGGDSGVVVNLSDEEIEAAIPEGTFTVQARQARDGFGNTDTLVSIEQIQATNSDDWLVGSADNNRFRGLGGADTIVGGDGIDTVDHRRDQNFQQSATNGVIVNLGETAVTATITGGTFTIGATEARDGSSGIDELEGIENALGTAFNDALFGSADNNRLGGEAGNDLLAGGAGDDTLDGGTGNDTFVIGVNGGHDRVLGFTAGGTDDRINVSALGITKFSTIQEKATAGDGNVVIDFGNGNTLTIEGVDSVAKLTAGDFIFTTAIVGGVGNDPLNGTANGDIMEGLGGNDTLNGNGGADSMFGGVGDDVYVVENVNDEVTEGLDQGRDTVRTGLSYELGENFENLELLGSVEIDGTGNELDNAITGNGAANTLTGGGGHDTLDGAGGADTLIGGEGDDVYVVGSLGDDVTELADEGTDMVRSTITYTLGSELEELVLLGTLAIDGTGNEANNRIDGNAAANKIDGGLGADTMAGGGGNDTYTVDEMNDVVEEKLNQGVDTVFASATFTITGHVENLTLTGVENIDGTGNDLVNAILGNEGNNRLDGGKLGDKMTGGKGDDTYIVDSLADVVTEGTGVDSGTDEIVTTVTLAALAANVENLTLSGLGHLNGTGNALANVITGNDGNNILTGAGGTDTLVGGDGDDTYVVDGIDEITENPGEGIDTVQTTADFTLGADFEKLTLLGTASIDGKGNEADNTIVGNAGANVIEGGAGGDTLTGGTGLDTLSYAGSAAAVNVRLVLGALAVVSGGDADGDKATGFENLIGSDEGDALTGDTASNRIDGGAGADTMAGGSGNDTYIVDNTDDKILENPTQGADSVFASVTFTLGAHLENLTLTGVEDLEGTGNDLVNTLVGNEGNNRLDGGKLGDKMTGGKGDDTYIVDSTADVVTEGSGVDSGTDEIVTTVTLPALVTNVENLTLSGLGNLNGTGNILSNVITGNDGNNVLDGGINGADTLVGGAGADTLKGGVGNDDLTGGNGADKFVFNSAVTAANADVITDFEIGSDLIQLENAIFAKLTVQGIALKGTNFFAGTDAQTSTQFIIYDEATGGLYYDADGSGLREKVQFATVENNAPLSASDFFVI